KSFTVKNENTAAAVAVIVELTRGQLPPVKTSVLTLAANATELTPSSLDLEPGSYTVQLKIGKTGEIPAIATGTPFTIRIPEKNNPVIRNYINGQFAKPTTVPGTPIPVDDRKLILQFDTPSLPSGADSLNYEATDGSILPGRLMLEKSRPDVSDFSLIFPDSVAKDVPRTLKIRYQSDTAYTLMNSDVKVVLKDSPTLPTPRIDQVLKSDRKSPITAAPVRQYFPVKEAAFVLKPALTATTDDASARLLINVRRLGSPAVDEPPVLADLPLTGDAIVPPAAQPQLQLKATGPARVPVALAIGWKTVVESEPVVMNLQSHGPRVESVFPLDLSQTPGANNLTVRFRKDNPVAEASAQEVRNY